MERLAQKSRRLYVAVALALASGLSTVGTGAQAASVNPAVPTKTSPSAAVQPLTAPPAERLTQLTRTLVDAGAPGVILRVDDGRGRVVEVAQQASWTRKDHRLTVRDEFRMASNTKTMVATLVLQLVAERKLALNDSVATWLPGLVPNGEAITVRMLLNHTSGLFDYAEDPAVLPSIVGRDQRQWTSTQLLAMAVKHPPLFAPGAQWSYSNTNYAALGAVLGKVTGQTLADLIEQRIARPLHLKHTYYATDASWRGRHAHGYELDAAHLPPGTLPPGIPWVVGPAHDNHVDVSGITPSVAGAAGAVVSTAADWSRFYTALMSGKLLPAAQLKEMLTTVPTDEQDPKKGTGYGLGIQKVSTACGNVWAHGGDILGYASRVYTDRTGRRTAMLLTTTDSGLAFVEQMGAAHQALETAAVCTMLGKPVPATPSPATSASVGGPGQVPALVPAG